MKRRICNAPILMAALAAAACGESGDARVGAAPAAMEQSTDERTLLAACDADVNRAGCVCAINAAKATLSDADYEAFVRFSITTIRAAAASVGEVSLEDNAFAASMGAAELATDPALAARMPRIMTALEAATETCGAN